MSATVQTTLSTLRALPGNLDLSALDGVSLPDLSALSGLGDLTGDWTPFAALPTFIGLSNGDFGMTLAGTGFGPLDSAEAFAAALAAGTVTGTVTGLGITEGGTPLASITFAPGVITLSIGTAQLVLETTLPSSLQSVFALIDVLPALLDPGAATGQERAQIEALMSPFILTGLSLTDNGAPVLAATMALDSVTLELAGMNITLTGAPPVNLGEGAALLFEIADQLGVNAGVAPDVAIYDADGNELTSNYETFGDNAYYGGSDVSETIYVGVSVGGGAPGDYQLVIEDFGIADSGVAENGDAGQTTATAQAVPMDSIVMGTLGSAGDMDWYEVQTTPFETTYAFVSAASSLDIGALSGLSLTGMEISFDGLAANQVMTFTGDVEGVVEGLLSGVSDELAVQVNGVNYGDLFLDLDDPNAASSNVLEASNSMGLGFGGDDTMAGGTGDDFLDGGADADLLFGNRGDDTLLGQDGDDRLDGGQGFDSVVGGNGDDTLFGGSGFDTLRGGEGADRVVGGDGRDLAYLGGGNDIFIDNTQGGVNGRDTVFANAGNDTVGGGNGDDVFHGQAGADLLLGRLGHDRLFGGDQNDTLVGAQGDDTVAGGNGRDRAFMGDGNDIWFDNDQVQFGEDVVAAGRGDDTIQMWGGDDRATGGDGADAFHFIGTDFGRDVITDYAVGEDRIGIDGGLMTLTQEALDAVSDTSSGDLVLTFNADAVLVLEGLSSTAGLLSDLFEL